MAVPTVPPKLASLPSSDLGRKSPRLLLHRQGGLCRNDLFPGPPHLAPLASLSWEEEHWEESAPPSDPPGCITGKSLAPALGTSAGHFDVVFWLVLGPASLLLCLGLFLRVLPKASETLSSPLKRPSLSWISGVVTSSSYPRLKFPSLPSDQPPAWLPCVCSDPAQSST